MRNPYIQKLEDDNLRRRYLDMALNLISAFAITMFFPVWVFAGEHNESEALPKVTNQVYKTNCGSCHFAYQPGLFPAKSWLKVIDSPDGHAGGDLSLEETTKAEIRKYLTQNSAEKTRSKRSRKILASIGSGVPTRISEVPYIKEKHHEINQEVFLKKSIRSRGNCVACHKTAESGDYNDDNVTIPK
jgi:mono/diheme cytochrome c family protein